MVIIDGSNMVLGRLASQVAKKLLSGEEIHIINCERIIMSGDSNQVAGRYLQKRRLKHKGTPEYSPKWSKMPNLLVRRMIRGMLPWKSARGREAFKRLRVYIGNPKNFGTFAKLEYGMSSKSYFKKSTTVLDLCRQLGYVG